MRERGKALENQSGNKWLAVMSADSNLEQAMI
jgi:hypothetical protein